ALGRLAGFIEDTEDLPRSLFMALNHPLQRVRYLRDFLSKVQARFPGSFNFNQSWDTAFFANAQSFAFMAKDNLFSGLDTDFSPSFISQWGRKVEELLNITPGFSFRQVGPGGLHGRPQLGNAGIDKNGSLVMTAFEVTTPWYIAFYETASYVCQ